MKLWQNHPRRGALQQLILSLQTKAEKKRRAAEHLFVPRPAVFLVSAASCFAHVHFFFDPLRQHVRDIGLLVLRQRFSCGDMVPFLQAAPAAAGGGVLGDKDRMAPLFVFI